MHGNPTRDLQAFIADRSLLLPSVVDFEAILLGAGGLEVECVAGPLADFPNPSGADWDSDALEAYIRTHFKAGGQLLQR